MIATNDEFYRFLTGSAKQMSKNIPDIKYAEVVELKNGEPVIKFDGDNSPSQKTYRRLRHYSPEVGERVVLINNIIYGGIK